MEVRQERTAKTNLNRKTNLLSIAILLLFLGSSVILENSSNSSSARQIGGTSAVNSIQPTDPVELDSILYDHYSNGDVVNRGSNNDPLARPASTYSHPLSKNETLVIGRDEIATIPVSSTPDSCFILDDAYNEFQMIHKLPDEYPWYSINFIAGNIDEDPLDELLIVSRGGANSARVYIYDDAKHNYTLLWSENLVVYWEYVVVTCNIAVGNFDNDPLNEIVVFLMSWHPDHWTHSSGFFWVIDLNESSAIVANKKIWDNWENDDNNVWGQSDLAVGDFDQDEIDEFVISVAFMTCSDNTFVFDDASTNFAQIDCFGYSGTDAQVEVGDFDGDGVEEIASCISSYITSSALGHTPQLTIWKYVGGSFEATTIELFTSYVAPDCALSITLVAGDLDGDGRDEIVVLTWLWWKELYQNFVLAEKRGYIYEYSVTTYSYEITKVWLDSAFYSNGDPYNFLDGNYFTTGDIDGDGMDEIISSGTSNPTMALDDAKNGFAPMMVPDENFHGPVTCGDFDGDGMILRYTGESWVLAAPPAVVAVIAAPPCYADIDQNYVSSWTGWGTETTHGTEQSTAVGTTVGTKFSFERKSAIFWVSFGQTLSNSFRNEFARTNTITKTEAVSQSFNSGWTEDAVVFHQTSYTSYLYEITAHPLNMSLVGTYMTIDVPEAPVLHKVGLNEFNENYESIDIGTETFIHTPGEPWTYPSRQDVPLITRSWLDSGDPIEVGQGSGFNFAEIQITETSGKGFETTQASEFAFGFSIGLGGTIEYGTGSETEISFEFSQGVFETKAYQISVGERTYYEGAVGDIAEWDVWNQIKYTYGLFIYYQSHPGGCLYLVVNYYVDGAIPATTQPRIVVIGGAVILTAALTMVTTILVRKKRR